MIFAPLMGWIAHDFGWRYVFYVMGSLGILVGFVWIKTIYGPKDHPGINEAEFDYIGRAARSSNSTHRKTSVRPTADHRNGTISASSCRTG